MNARKIREDLGRVKTSCQRGDLPRAIYLTISWADKARPRICAATFVPRSPR